MYHLFIQAALAADDTSALLDQVCVVIVAQRVWVCEVIELIIAFLVCSNVQLLAQDTIVSSFCLGWKDIFSAQVVYNKARW